MDSTWVARRWSLAVERVDFLGTVMNAGNCAFLPVVANAMTFAAEMKVADGCSRRRQVAQFLHQSSYLLGWSYGRDLCCDGREAVDHVLHAAQAIDCVAIAGPVHHRHVCHLRFALLPQFDS